VTALERLATDAIASAQARRHAPGATYRLQFHAQFTLQDALALVPYFEALGITHLYASPLLAARPGSTHGYDIIDHDRLNPEIGTEADLAALASALHDRGMGLILDVVPNHMCVSGDNAWWADVLEHGPASPFAGYFDIAWYDSPRGAMHGRLLLPVLGEPYGQVLEAGQLQPRFERGGFVVRYWDAVFPLDPRTYAQILSPALDVLRTTAEPDSHDIIELRSILTAIRHLPPREEADLVSLAEGRTECGVIKRRLAELASKSSRAARAINEAVTQLAGVPDDPASFAALDALLESQAYRLSFWRVASDEINYRRFFDVNELAALSTEREDVFRAVHRKWLGWVADGRADGLRIDHPDGLFDPKQYLDRLQTHYLLAVAARLLAAEPEKYEGVTFPRDEGELLELFSLPSPLAGEGGGAKQDCEAGAADQTGEGALSNTELGVTTSARVGSPLTRLEDSPPSPARGEGKGTVRPFRFLICWFAAYLVFFSAAATKLPNYVLPLYPAIAILTARFLTRWRSGALALPKWMMPSAIAALVLTAVATTGGLLVAGAAVKLLPAGSRVFPGAEWWAVLGIVPLAAAVVMARAIRANDRARFVRTMALGSVAFTALLAAFPPLAIDTQKAPRELVRASGVADPSRDIRLAHFDWFQPSVVFYAQREVAEVKSAELAALFLAVPTPGYLFIPAKTWEQHVETKVWVPTRVVARHHDFYRNCEVLVVTNDVTAVAGR
jgi:hypothetical protein